MDGEYARHWMSADVKSRVSSSVGRSGSDDLFRPYEISGWAGYASLVAAILKLHETVRMDWPNSWAAVVPSSSVMLRDCGTMLKIRLCSHEEGNKHRCGGAMVALIHQLVSSHQILQTKQKLEWTYPSNQTRAGSIPPKK